jgi:CheY-like chemotaxis protein
VDDNAINRRLVTVLLKNAGHSVDSATNGREAVEAAARTRYDAILMDIQMPVMNGVQATRRIRSLPAPYAAVPVIALTADALSDAAQRYRSVGLDAYLSKPLSPPALFATLETLVRDGRPPQMIPVAPVVDRSTLEQLRTFLPPDRFDSFIHETVTDVGMRIARLEALLGDGARVEAARAAHDLVSLAGNCGARATSGLARELERACREAPTPPSAQALRRAWDKAAEALEAVLAA